MTEARNKTQKTQKTQRTPRPHLISIKPLGVGMLPMEDVVSPSTAAAKECANRVFPTVFNRQADNQGNACQRNENKPPVGPFKARISGCGVPALMLGTVDKRFEVQAHTSRNKRVQPTRTRHPRLAKHSKLHLMLQSGPQTWRLLWPSSVPRGFVATGRHGTNCTSRCGPPTATRAGKTLLHLTMCF